MTTAHTLTNVPEPRPRAQEVLKRRLALRARLKLAGKLNHEELFFKGNSDPLRNLQYPWVRWKRILNVTLQVGTASATTRGTRRCAGV